MHQPNEPLRKSLHILFGLFALTLKWLPWWLAAVVAGCAVLGNWLVLHKIVGTRISRNERGWDAGIVLYPLAVLLLILIFRDDLHVAAVAWAVLAFGDGIATLVGQAIGGRRLPWNLDKSWAGSIAFVVGGFLPVWLVSWYVSDEPSLLPRAMLILLILIAGAVVESLPLGVDDNLTVPLGSAVAAAILTTMQGPRMNLDHIAMAWLVLNTLLAVLGYASRSVNLSGMIGGWALGAILIVFGWPTLYIVLLAFFVIGTVATKLGYRRKEQEGLAQEEGGRRGFGHAFANVGVAAICALAMAFSGGVLAFFWAAVASLATAAADTVATEIGQLFGRHAFLPLTFRRVPRGTEGAISIEGTVAGVLAAFLVAVVGVAAFGTPPSEPWTIFSLEMNEPFWFLLGPVVIAVTLAAVAGSYLESIVGSWNRSSGLGISNGALNFFNTAVGAILILMVAPSLQWM